MCLKPPSPFHPHVPPSLNDYFSAVMATNGADTLPAVVGTKLGNAILSVFIKRGKNASQPVSFLFFETLEG